MQTQDIRKRLSIDCENCCGLCCVAFYCAKADGFPQDKKPGIPCVLLDEQYRCKSHDTLFIDKRRGCLSFDCFGAGQRTEQFYKGNTGIEMKNSESEMYLVFSKLMQFHQSIWYLLEVYDKTKENQMKDCADSLLDYYEHLECYSVKQFLSFDVEKFRKSANSLLKKYSQDTLLENKKKESYKKDFIGEDMRNFELFSMDFTMSFLMAANFEDCTMDYVNFLGADMRDANIKGADLSESLFLTQMQINSCIGDNCTKLPEFIQKPIHWNC